MSSLEERIRGALDSLEERPDPARIMQRVGGRKRHFRMVRRMQTAALVVVVVAGVGGGTYALARAFGVGSQGPVPATTPPSGVPTTAPSHTAPPPSTSPSATASPTPSATATTALCTNSLTSVAVRSSRERMRGSPWP